MVFSVFIGPSNAYEDDACLIKLSGEAKYSNSIKPVCLPTNGQQIVENQVCKIAGWGVTTSSKKMIVPCVIVCLDNIEGEIRLT